MEIYNCDKISNWDESLSSWFEFIIMMKIHNENSSLLGKFIIAIEYSSLDEVNQFNGWIFQIMIIQIFLMKIHHCDENSVNVEKSTL